ncbi:MAG: glycosyltransferase family 4 protein, partial [Bdellovibrionia bacterium]
MLKIGLISSAHESGWISCKTIVKNLFASYDGLFGDAEVRRFGILEDTQATWETAREIAAWKPDELIFVDHSPHPVHLLAALYSLYGGRKLPVITIHVFGDFSIYPAEWMQADPVLLKMRVRFICASPRQRELVLKFLRCDDIPEVCPFPVDTAIFRYNERQRNEWRTRLGLKDGEIAITYGGRVSLQKNVGMLISEFRKLISTGTLDAKLFIAGPFDGVNAPLFNLNFQRGFYYHRFRQELAALPDGLRDRVRYLGNLNSQALAGLNNASELVCSLSLHHDEDFGMAPAEALLCGTPAVLTDWGGYASFGGNPEDVDFVPVRTAPKGLKLSSIETRRRILRMIARGPGNRQERAERFERRVSIHAVREILRDIRTRSAPTFKGFSYK